MKLTRHNGRSGKHGTYNPRHNDRRFDVENSEHIDAERARQNVYWDCYRGFTTHDFRENPEQPDFSFEEIERMYYYEHYADHVEAQNARNEKTRHTERNRTVEDLLKNNKTCPEESIYQIGTMGESVPPDTLFSIVNEFYEEFERRFGSHIHILNWALHLDEGTPHIHERHVFDCENRYGELCPQQEKALEELGIPLPNPEKPKGRNNNRKQTFDAVCRTILFDIARRHGLHLDQEPSYGGRDYLEKQDYILMKQKEQLAAQEQKLEELTLKIEDVETLLDDVSDAAYDKAVEVVTDSVRQETHKEDIRLVEESKKWVLSPERKAPKKEREYAAERLDGVITKIKNAMQHALAKIQRTLMQPEVKQARIAGLLALTVYLNPTPANVEASAKSVSGAERTVYAKETSAPAGQTSDYNMTCVKLEEKERWILDEVLSDYVSEDVVELTDNGIDYSIGDWVDRDTYTYLFFTKKLPGGTVYTAVGYAKTMDGSYVYFELSSPERMTEQQVDLEITKTFGNPGASEIQAC